MLSIPNFCRRCTLVDAFLLVCTGKEVVIGGSLGQPTSQDCHYIRFLLALLLNSGSLSTNLCESNYGRTFLLLVHSVAVYQLYNEPEYPPKLSSL